MSAIPIQLSELFQLPNLGIPQNVISFSTVTMEGQYVCVRDTAGTEKTIRIIDAQTQNVTTNKGNAVEAAIMHPSQKIIALRAGNTCQVFDLDQKQKLSQITMNEAVVFWKWVSDKLIALVTQTAVYHWSYTTTEQPTKVFDRHASLESAQIINYRTDKKQQWLLLVGLVPGGETGFKGAMQLYSVERAVTQAIEGHAACFVDFALSSTYTTSLICIASASAQGGKLFIMEVPTAKPESAPQFQRKAVQVQFAPGDFPVAMQSSDKHGLIYLITKGGYLFLFDAETGTRIYSSRISQEPIFVTAPYAPNNGVIGINRVGQVLSVSVDENNIVPCINNMGLSDLAFKIATRAQLPGAIELYVTQFNALLQQQNIEEAIKLAVEAPNGVLRTPQTIQRLQKYPIQAPKPPLSIYFNMIIQSASLNKHESIELALLVLQKPQGAEYIKKLLGENKIEASEQLGDVLRQYNLDLAMSIYLKCQSHDRIIDCLIQKGEPAKVLRYCERVGFTPNYLDIFRKILAVNADEAVKFASELVPKKQLDGNVVVDVFVQANMIKQATHFLLDALKDDKPEDGSLQTRLLEINLLYSPPQVADSILKQDMFHHYDKKRVAQLCEQVGLFLRALENFTDVADRKRVIVNCPFVQPDPTEWLVGFLGTLSPNDVLALLRELMKGGQRQNLNIVVQAASKYHEELTEQDPNALIALFEEYRSFEGLFYYLGSIVDYSKDPEVHFKYIQAAVKMGNIPEVVRITQESDIYDPVKTKEFLKESKLADLTPLMNVCDKHGYIEEMVTYFYNNQALKYIDMYVKQKNPLKTPNVIGALLDVDASEEFIKNLLLSVGQMCPIEPLVQEVEKRNRLKLLLPWLEARINEGNTEPATHNALAKIYIDLNNNPEQFLLNNQYYDPRVVGKYCEKRDPHLSFIAYKKGQCDIELVDVTNKNGMFKQQARYLVQRQNPELWAVVLANPQYRRQIIDQVVQTALPETTNTEEVSSTVKAFIAAQLPNELIELLEQIVLHGSSEFKKNKNLQNLLILTAIRADTRRVMDYINRLDNYDAPDIAEIAVQKELYNEAFVIYSKFKLNTSAIRVLIERTNDIAAATEFADKVQENEVFSILGRAQLAHSLVPEAITSFLKSSDATSYHEVISAAQRTENFGDLIKFLKMARAKVQDSLIDTELVYSLAKFAAQQNNASGLADLEDFISSPNTAQIQVVGDRAFEEGLYEASRILFGSISNWSRLAATYIKLSRHREAVNAALKANSIKTFKEVMASCIDANEFKLAQQCALNIITQADEIDDLVHYYEIRGYWEELLELLERGTSIERPPNAVFGSLALMYAKYRPEKLMDHITRHYKKLHIPRLINACEQNHLWAEMRFLLVIHEEFDQAIRVMIDHSADAWDHTAFTDTILKVVNMELYYKSIQFYLEEQPQLVVDLLKVISQRLDNERVAREVRQTGNLALIKDYLVSIQDLNLQQVNEAINFLYIEEEDYENLRSSIENHTNFDQVTLAKKLESHELLEFRRIASFLYKVKKQYQSSIELSKKDKLYKDAIETAADSESQEVAEDLLKFFVENSLNECFAAALYTCYNLVRPDVALELSWRYKITDMAMPFLVQVLREYTTKVDELYRANKEAKQLQEAQMRQQELSAIQDPAQYAYAAVPIVDPNQYPPQAFPPQQSGWF